MVHLSQSIWMQRNHRAPLCPRRRQWRTRCVSSWPSTRYARLMSPKTSPAGHLHKSSSTRLLGLKYIAVFCSLILMGTRKAPKGQEADARGTNLTTKAKTRRGAEARGKRRRSGAPSRQAPTIVSELTTRT